MPRDGIGTTPVVPRTTSAELSLINDTDFLDELEQHEPRANAPALEGPAPFDDGYDGFEAGLPLDDGALQAGVPHHERAPIANPYDDEPMDEPAGAGKRIPWIAAALVLIACLTAGAATAVIFHDRLPAISAVLPASR